MALTVVKSSGIDITGNYTVNGMTITANVSAANANLGNSVTANYFIGNGALLTGIAAGYSNTNVAAYLPTYTGNVSANYFVGNGSTLTYITGANITGNVTSAVQSHFANIANSVAGSNISGQVGNALVAGTVYTNAQPNITSVGTLVSLTITGNITSGNASLGNLATATYFSGDGSLLTGITGTYSNSNVAAYLPTYTGNVSANYFIGNGSTLTYITGANITGNVTSAVQSHFANIANSVAGSNISGQVGNALVAGTVYTNAQPNITSVGTLSSLSVTGNITSGNASLGNLATATYFNGDGIYLSNIAGANVSGTVANATYATSAGSATTATTAATVTTNAQPNITSVGTLTSLTITGNITSGNASLGNLATATYFSGDGSLLTGLPASYSNTNVAAYLPTYTGNVSANYFIGNGATLTYITGSNVNGNVTSAVQSHYANIANSVAGSNVSGQVGNALVAGTVYTNAQPNITSVGTLVSLNVSGDATVTGNFTVGGNTTYINVETFRVEDPIIELGGGVNGAPLISNDGKDRGSLLHYYTTGVVDAFMGWDNSNGEFAFGSNVSVSSEVVTFNRFGNVRANYFIGNGSTLTDITGSNVSGNVTSAVQSHFANIANSVAGSNVSGQVGNALVAGTVYTNAQPNITSVGTLASLSVTGNITSGNANITGTMIVASITTSGSAGNITGANYINANFFTGNGSLLTGLPASYSNTNVAAYLPTYTGNVSANYFIGNGSTLTYITGANVSGNVTSAVQSHYANIANSVAGSNVDGQVGNALVAGTVYTNAQPNITSVGTLASLTVTGNVTSGNASLGNLASATYFSGNGIFISNIAGANVSGTVANATYATSAGSATSATTAGTVTANAQPNITSVGTIASLTGTGTINFTGASNVALGPVANVHITGGTAGYVLSTNGGGVLDWVAQTGGGGSPGGSNTYVQFNDSSTFGGDSQFTYNKTTDVLTVGNITANGAGISYITGSNVTGNVTSAVQSHFANIANSVAGGNVSGQVGNALVAGTVYTNAQPNITSVGTLASLTVTANITSGNADLGNLVTASYFSGDGIYLSNIAGANVTGTVANATYATTAGSATSATTAATVTTNAQPNITSVGTLASLVVTANITSGNASLGNLVTATYFSGNGSLLTYITGSNVDGNVTSAVQAHYANIANSVAGGNVSGQVGNALVAGTVYTNAQPNITSVGTLVSLTVTGNITSGNASLGNLATATYFSGDGSLLTGLPAGYANSNVAAYLPTYTGNVSANYFIGNGSTLTTITGANVTGNVTSAVQAHYANIANSVTGSNVSGQVGNALVAGTVYTNAQPNITSVGTLASLTITGNITSGNADLGNLVTATYFSGNGSLLTGLPSGYANSDVATFLASYGSNIISTTGNVTAGYFIGNGSTLSAIAGANVTGNVTSAVQSHFANIANSVAGSNVSGQVSNALVAGTVYTNAQPNITSVGTLVSLTVTGNSTSGNASLGNLASATYFSGDGSLLTNITGGNVTGIVANATYATSAGSATTAATVTTNAQPNITSVGTLASLTVTGNITSGNASLGNLASATYFSGDGSLLTNITGANINGNVTSAVQSHFANIANSVAGGNVSGQVGNALVAGTVYTNAQPNITSVGTLASLSVSGDATVTGNFTVGGTTTYINVETFRVEDPIIELGGGANGDPLTTNDGKDRGTLLHYYTTGVVDAFMGWDNSNGEFAFGSNVSVSSEVVTFNNFGNIRASYFIGNGSQLTGTIANANYSTYAGTVITAAQPNITSVGTLASLSITGNVTSGNASLGNLATASYFSGDGSLLTGLPASYSNTNVAAYLPTYTGNVSANYFIGNGSTLTYITGANVNGNVTSAVQSHYANIANSVAGSNVSGQVGNALVAGTVYTNAQPNITSVGTLSSLSVTGNITSGNIDSGNSAIANYFTGNGIYISNIAGANVTGIVANATYATSAGSATSATTTGTVTTNAQPNITSVGTITGLTGTGVIDFTSTSNVALGVVSNVHISGGTAGYVLSTDGSGALSWVAQSGGGGGSYGNSNVADYLPTYTGNVSANYFIGNGSVLTGQVGNALIAGTVYTNAQPNITSVGTLSALTVNGLTNLGAVGNLTITGGTANYVLQTNGSGALSWVAQSGGGGSPTITDDTTTNATYYPVYATASSGSLSTAGVSSTKLQFNPSLGQLTITDLNSLSDATLKTNWQTIDDPFSILDQLFGMGFEWTDNGRKSYGLSAQNVEQILPELVGTTAQGKKTVNYIPIIAFLLEALKKNNKELQEIKSSIKPKRQSTKKDK